MISDLIMHVKRLCGRAIQGCCPRVLVSRYFQDDLEQFWSWSYKNGLAYIRGATLDHQEELMFTECSPNIIDMLMPVTEAVVTNKILGPICKSN